MGSLRDRVVVVTGGTSGIGLGIATAFRDAGASVVATGATEAEVDAAGSIDGIMFHTLNVRDPAMINAVAENFGPIAALVDCAGVNLRAAEFTEEGFTTALDINLTGTYLMCREALPHLQKSPDAYILNVQSTGAWRANPGVSLYAASKFGVRALTEALIEEYRDSNVRITSVSPGPVATNIWSHKREPPSAELRPGQEDAHSLPPYDVLDPILEGYVEHDLGAEQLVARGFDAKTVERVIRLVDLAEYKRRQQPPGIKITTKSFGRDRRMPITNRYRG